MDSQVFIALLPAIISGAIAIIIFVLQQKDAKKIRKLERDTAYFRKREEEYQNFINNKKVYRKIIFEKKIDAYNHLSSIIYDTMIYVESFVDLYCSSKNQNVANKNAKAEHYKKILLLGNDFNKIVATNRFLLFGKIITLLNDFQKNLMAICDIFKKIIEENLSDELIKEATTTVLSLKSLQFSITEDFSKHIQAFYD